MVGSVIRNRREEDRDADGDVKVNRLHFPEAARFELVQEQTVEPPATVQITMASVADVSAGDSVVVSAGVGGGLLLLRRRRKPAQ